MSFNLETPKNSGCLTLPERSLVLKPQIYIIHPILSSVKENEKKN